MYIDDFDAILGNTQKEDSLLQYMQDSSFNYLALYDLGSLDYSNTSEMNMLSSFIVKARTQYGIPNIGSVGETFSFFKDNIKSYNNSRANANEKFNVFNLEFEFWTEPSVQPGGYYCVKYLQPGGCNCDTAGAFRYYISVLHSMDSLAATQNAISETYVGWFNQGQGQQIQANVDRILLHAYRVDNTSVWGYSKTRLGYLAANNQMVNVAPIFSSEQIFMGPWLDNHSQQEAFEQYETDFQNDNSSWKPYINLLGYQWFDWSNMRKPAAGAGGAASISASGSTSFCPGGIVTLTATTGSSYHWSNGETTRSINASSSGNYFCNVTQNGNTQTTNSISVTVYAAPVVSLIVNNPLNNTVPLASNAIPGSGNITGYQWRLNSSGISGASNAEYVATESGDYSLVATNSYGCSNSSTEASVTVPSNDCILAVPDGVYSDQLSESSAMIHWDPVGVTDSIIIRYKIESSTDYIYIRLANTGQTSLQLNGLQPGTEYSWRMKTVCATSSGNYSTKKYFITEGATGIAEAFVPHSASDVAVFPNPATNDLHIEITSDVQQKAELILSDITGNVVHSSQHELQIGETLLNEDVSLFAKGIYLMSLRTETETIVRKISVE